MRGTAPGTWPRAAAAVIARRPRLVLTVCLALTAAALIPAARLHVDSDLSALLPARSPAAADYRVFLRTFGGFEKVFVLVRAADGAGGDPGPLEDAAAALADELRGSPEIADARSGRTPEDESFFYHHVAPRLPLLAGGDAVELARRLTPKALRRRVEIMRQTLAAPGGGALAPLFASDPLGLAEGLLDSAAAAMPMDPLSGAFLSRRGDAALVILTPARAEIDPAGGRALLARLAAAYRRVRAQSPVALTFQAVGGPIYAAQDEGILRGDLTRSVSGTLAGVTLVLLAGFEGLLLPAAVLMAVVAGLAWAAGAAGLVMPAVTVVGVGFAAALVGMGVDYGIHGGVQYRRLRLAGSPPGAALEGAFRATGPGVLTGALATAAGLAALAVAHFRPLREIGEVLALGVVATLTATVSVSAAVAVGVRGGPAGAGRPPAPPRLWPRWGLPPLRAVVGVAARRPRQVLAAVLALSVLAGWGLAHSRLSTDLRALRPADAPSTAAERQLVDSFGLGIDTLSVVVPGRDLDQALDRAAAVSELLRRRLGARAEIATPTDWLMSSARRARRLAELRRLPLAAAADELAGDLAAAGFRREPFAPALSVLRALGRGEDPGLPPPAVWPFWMRELVRTAPVGAVAPGLAPGGAVTSGVAPVGAVAPGVPPVGAVAPGVPPRDAVAPGVAPSVAAAPGMAPGGAVVAIHVRLPQAAGGGFPADLVRQVAAVAPGAAVASAVRVGAELRELALADLLRASLLALALVAAVVLASFRGRPGPALLAFLPLVLGCLWTFGAWGALGRPFDLLGIFTIPLLLGTGINLGAYPVHWRRLHPARRMTGTIEDVGLAMIMATFTTSVGFGSLVTSRVPGLANDGILVAAGITACLLATVLVLPALEALRTGWKVRP